VAPSLPDEVRAFDDALFAANLALDPAHLLNPINVSEAQAAFFAGEPHPPFRYGASAALPEWQERLHGMILPQLHPFSALLKDARSSFDAMANALRYRTAEHFERWATLEGWERGDASVPTTQVQTPSEPEPVLGAAGMGQALEAAIHARGLTGWQVVRDEIMSARVLVESTQQQIRVNPRATFRQSDVRRLVAHEIDVHVTRAENGKKQSLRLFSTGLPGNLQTEEGLAVAAEAQAGTLVPGAMARQAQIRSAIVLARQMGFRELWERLRGAYGPQGAFSVTLRLKRGLIDPGKPGVYAKDAVYGLGWAAVQRWRANGGDMNHVYVGKVALHHPVAEWLAEGLIVPGPVPALWATSPPE
jgi:hypothetical protein